MARIAGQKPGAFPVSSRREGFGRPVPIDARLLEILVCPACGGSVRALAEQSGIVCARCGTVHPIRDGIAWMIAGGAASSFATDEEKG